MGTVWFFLAAFFVFPLYAKPSCEALRENWKQYYVSAFGIGWVDSELPCDGGSLLVAEALYHLHDPLLPPGAPNFYDEAARLTSHLIHCPNGANAFLSTGTIALCPSYFRGDAEWRAAALVHEVRHLQSDDSHHVECARGAHKGDAQGCDQKFHAGNGLGSGFNAGFRYLGFLRSARHHQLRDWVIQSHINGHVPDRFNEITAAEVRQWRQD